MQTDKGADQKAPSPRWAAHILRRQTDPKTCTDVATDGGWDERRGIIRGRPPVAQWIRATDFGSVGRGFESLRAGQTS